MKLTKQLTLGAEVTSVHPEAPPTSPGHGLYLRLTVTNNGPVDVYLSQDSFHAGLDIKLNGATRAQLADTQKARSLAEPPTAHPTRRWVKLTAEGSTSNYILLDDLLSKQPPTQFAIEVTWQVPVYPTPFSIKTDDPFAPLPMATLRAKLKHVDLKVPTPKP